MLLFLCIRLVKIKMIMCKAGKVTIWIQTALLYIATVATCEHVLFQTVIYILMISVKMYILFDLVILHLEIYVIEI